MAEENGKIVGVAQFKVTGSEADLLKLFVEPTMLCGGLGTNYFTGLPTKQWQWGASHVVEADPDAAPFYRRMGAKDSGFAPSGSISGTSLPKLAKVLGSI